MTRATKKKHVVQELISVPDDKIPEENEKIVRVIGARGNYLFEVEELGKETSNFLVSMPVKFRKILWVKRGDCVMVRETPDGGKVKGEISEILTRKRIQGLRAAGAWPETDPNDSDDPEEFVNENRRPMSTIESDSSSSEQD